MTMTIVMIRRKDAMTMTIVMIRRKDAMTMTIVTVTIRRKNVIMMANGSLLNKKCLDPVLDQDTSRC
jgi:hypothetical protein